LVRTEGTAPGSSRKGEAVGESKRVSEVLESMYREMDPLAERGAKQMGSTCTKGCAHCCYLLTTATLSEGLLIAEKLLVKPDWKALLPRLRESALAHCYEGVSRVTYFEKKLPCVFLGKDNLCTIYDIRPACCRYHYVASDPAKCSPDDREGKTAVINLQMLEEKVWALSAHLGKQALDLDVPFVAPIPLLVLFCMELVSRASKAENQLIREACEGVLDPINWLQQYSPSIMSEGDGMLGIATDEELAQLRTPK
jgi:Fe-S-cluster containining protein